jgi:hypothetical protein
MLWLDPVAATGFTVTTIEAFQTHFTFGQKTQKRQLNFLNTSTIPGYLKR